MTFLFFVSRWGGSGGGGEGFTGLQLRVSLLNFLDGRGLRLLLSAGTGTSGIGRDGGGGIFKLLEEEEEEDKDEQEEEEDIVEQEDKMADRVGGEGQCHSSESWRNLCIGFGIETYKDFFSFSVLRITWKEESNFLTNLNCAQEKLIYIDSTKSQQIFCFEEEMFRCETRSFQCVHPLEGTKNNSAPLLFPFWSPSGIG